MCSPSTSSSCVSGGFKLVRVSSTKSERRAGAKCRRKNPLREEMAQFSKPVTALCCRSKESKSWHKCIPRLRSKWMLWVWWFLFFFIRKAFAVSGGVEWTFPDPSLMFNHTVFIFTLCTSFFQHDVNLPWLFYRCLCKVEIREAWRIWCLTWILLLEAACLKPLKHLVFFNWRRIWIIDIGLNLWVSTYKACSDQVGLSLLAPIGHPKSAQPIINVKESLVVELLHRFSLLLQLQLH